jgi:hypothetical protein
VLIVGLTLAVLSTALVDGGVLLDAITSNAIRDEPFAANSRVEGAMLVGIVSPCSRSLRYGSRRADRVPGLRPLAGHAVELARSARQLAAVAVYGLLLFFCGGVVRGLPWLSSS